MGGGKRKNKRKKERRKEIKKKPWSLCFPCKGAPAAPRALSVL